MVAPRTPPGTASVSYLGCQIDGTECSFWDFPPGLDAHYTDILKDMQFILLCYNGRCLSDSVTVLKSRYPSAKLMILVTCANVFSVYHLHGWAQDTLSAIPVCYSENAVWNEIVRSSST